MQDIQRGYLGNIQGVWKSVAVGSVCRNADRTDLATDVVQDLEINFPGCQSCWACPTSQVFKIVHLMMELFRLRLLCPRLKQRLQRSTLARGRTSFQDLQSSTLHLEVRQSNVLKVLSCLFISLQVFCNSRFRRLFWGGSEGSAKYSWCGDERLFAVQWWSCGKFYKQ